MSPPADPSALGRLLRADAALSARLALPPGPLRWPALLLAHSGNSPLWLAGGAVAALWGDPFWRAVGVWAIMGTVAGGVAATILKFAFRRRRPGASFAGLYSHFDPHAFPSGHATRAGCVAVVLAPLLPAWVAALLAVWAVLVCLARVSLQVHYLLDVLVGLLVGALVGALLLALL